MDHSCDLKYYTIRGSNEVVKAGDTVVISEEDNEHVAIVKSIKAHVDGHVKAEVRLYYRPEDTVGGRRHFHGSSELFLTNHFDTQSVFSIRRKCMVHNFLNYMRLKDSRPNDYFSRLEYNTGTAWFSPDSIEVFCKCELPFNPDVFMLKCESCKDWYHPDCIDMPADHAKQIDNFTCDSCQFVDSKRPHEKSPDPSMVESKRTKC